MNKEKISNGPNEELPEPIDSTLNDVFVESQNAKAVEHLASNAGPGQVSSQAPSSPSTHGSATPQVAGPSVATPQIADDEDLIEKAWIESAKRIVAQTQGDPHARSEKMNVVKTDYKKKRFNIDSELGKVE